ncbi:MAG: LPP20 family lipoprotein [Elusimicrobia bacterium]|nr:LPP20 family lipoprotein [Elusimicrobiota bacterium]
MNHRSRLSALFLAAALLSACAGGRRAASAGGSRPAWVDGQGGDWPKSRFITGLGSADDENTAADRARGEVARVFSADVSVNTVSDQSEGTVQKDGKSSTSFSSTVAEQVRTAAEKVLEGVDVVARWKDSSVGRYYALAALPKEQALIAVNEKAHDIGAEAAIYKAQLASSTDAFERAKAAAKLLTLAKAWSGLANDSRVLGGGSLSGDFDTAAVRPEAAKAMAALDVVVAVTGEGSDAVEIAAVEGLNAAGLSAKRGTAGDKADLTATASVNVQEQDAGDPRWKRSRAIAAVTLQDGRTGKAFASFDVTAREDAVDAGEARRRTLASLAKKTSEKITASINDFFANQ